MIEPAIPPRHRDAWLEIDLDAIRHNVRLIRILVAPAAVAPVVKADAYGHGLDPVAAALEHDVEALCVATLDEAMALRARVARRVLVLYPVPEASLADAIAARVELTAMSTSDLRAVAAAAERAGRRVSIQVCVETGLGRGGLTPAQLAAATELLAHPRLELAGLWTHLASPEDAERSRLQTERFDTAMQILRAGGLGTPPRHVAASGAIFAATAPPLDLVRPGLAMYGVLDVDLPVAATAAATAAQLRPAMALKARAVAFSDIPRGGTVGYGGRWRAQRPSRIAILPVGYGDGYLRATQPGAVALVRGVRAPLAGVVSMDAVAVDVTDQPGVDHADEFVLLGVQGSDAITAGDLARRRNTIAWEVLSGMAERLGRVYYAGAGTTPPG